MKRTRIKVLAVGSPHYISNELQQEFDIAANKKFYLATDDLDFFPTYVGMVMLIKVNELRMLIGKVMIDYTDVAEIVYNCITDKIMMISQLSTLIKEGPAHA